MHDRRLLAILAHPDDESLGIGSTLARYAEEGVACHLVSATRGERGWQGAPEEYPGPAALGELRTRELREAGQLLGLRSIDFLDYLDGDLDQAPPGEIVPRIVAHIRRIRPQVVITFPPDGAYGHPDHIAISQFCAAALVAAADPTFPLPEGEWAPHRVQKFYFYVASHEEMRFYGEQFGPLEMEVDGLRRAFPGWEPWAITTRVDGGAHWQRALEAICCHESQLHAMGGSAALRALMGEHRQLVLGERNFYRVFSFVNGGRGLERDLFEGLP